MVRLQLDALKQQPLHWSWSPFPLADVHQSNNKLFLNVGIGGMVPQLHICPHLGEFHKNCQEIHQVVERKQLFLGLRPRVLCFLINFWFLEKRVGVDG